MKKITFLIVALFIALGASAQKDEKAAGFTLNYGSEIESIGFGTFFNYNLTDQIRLAPDFTYFFENNGLNEWDLNLNAHYLFPLKDTKLTVYPIGGVLITHWSAGTDVKVEGLSISVSETKFGINLGGGVQYDFTKNLFFKGELKYSFVSDFDQAVISAGIGYKF